MPYFKIYCSSSNVDDYRCTWSKLLFTIRAISKFYVAIFKKLKNSCDILRITARKT